MSTAQRRAMFSCLEESGTARLIFREERHFQGTLEAQGGNVLSVSGRPAPSSSECADIEIVDGDEGNLFLLQGAKVDMQGNHAVIQHDGLSFSSTEKLLGMRAAKEVREHLDPRMANDENCDKWQLYVGPMKVSLLAIWKSKVPARRESVCQDSTTIIEASNDFFA